MRSRERETDAHDQVSALLSPGVFVVARRQHCIFRITPGLHVFVGTLHWGEEQQRLLEFLYSSHASNIYFNCNYCTQQAYLAVYAAFCIVVLAGFFLCVCGAFCSFLLCEETWQWLIKWLSKLWDYSICDG